MNDLIDRLSAETGMPAPDVERLLVEILAPQIRSLYEAEVAAAERAAELQGRITREGLHARARTKLRRWLSPASGSTRIWTTR